MVSCLGSLVQSRCGEGGALQTDIAGVWGALAVFRPHWVCPRSQVSVLSRLHCSGSRLLYMERALRCVRFQFSGTPQKRRLSWACVFCAFPGRAAQAARSLTGALSPGAGRLLPSRSQPQFPRAPVRCVQLVSILGSWPLAATLPVDVDHPESQEVFG